MGGEMSDELTKEEIAEHYHALMQSVKVANNLMDAGHMAIQSEIEFGLIDDPDEREKAEHCDALWKNVKHLEIILQKDYWTDEDMSAAHTCIDRAKANHGYTS